MATTNFIPEVWSAQLLTSLKKSLVFGSPAVVNRDYEGEIAQAGDTVKITSISRPTVATYTKGSTTITPETLTDSQRSLVITECKYFAFEVDDVDMRQAKNGGALMAGAAQEAAYALADTADQYLASLFESYVASANVISTTTINTADLADSYLLSLAGLLNEANVPMTGRYVIVPSWYHVLLESKLSNVSTAGTDSALRSGQVGQLHGFTVLMSNNVTLVTGDDYRICAGYPGAITFADQINKVEAYRPQDAFSDALKGLHLYGAKVTRPTGLATLLASKT